MPVTITRPAHPCRRATASVKRASSRGIRPSTASASMRSTRAASARSRASSIMTDPRPRRSPRSRRAGAAGRRGAACSGRRTAGGRPASVRSGSSWISMNSASTPTATAARARAWTYWRSPPERSPCPPGQLHRVRGVEDHGIAEFAHDRQAPEVHHEVVVAEARPALRQQDVLAPRGANLLDDIAHVARGEELSLLHVDGPAASRAREEQVRLPAQEGRHLEHVEDLGGGPDLRDVVDVGEHGEARDLLHAGQDAQAFLEAGAAIRVHRGPVGLVVGRLVDERDAGGGRDRLQPLGHHQGMRLVLDGARSPDERERCPAPDGDAGDPDGAGRHAAGYR